MAFIVAAANLRAGVFGFKGSTDHATVLEIVNKVDVPKFKPRSGVKIAADEKEAAKEREAQAAAASSGIHEVLQQAEENLPKPSSLVGFRVNPVEFEKDDDINFHMDFIAATANLR